MEIPTINGRKKEDTKMWKFISSNFSLCTGFVRNLKVIEINNQMHYEFDLYVKAVGSRRETFTRPMILKKMVSCPYLQMTEHEHSVMKENSLINVFYRTVPLLDGSNKKNIVENRKIAMRVEKATRNLFSAFRRYVGNSFSPQDIF